MRKQYIQIFIEQHWAFLNQLRENHYSLRDRLIEGWQSLDASVRTETRASFWQFMQDLDRAFEAHRDEMGQYRDQQLIASRKKIKLPLVIRESAMGQLHQIYDSYHGNIKAAWDKFFYHEEALPRATQPVGESGMIGILHDYLVKVVQCRSKHWHMLNGIGDSAPA